MGGGSISILKYKKNIIWLIVLHIITFYYLIIKKEIYGKNNRASKEID